MLRLLLAHPRIILAVALSLSYAGLMLFGGCADKIILYPTNQPIPALTAHQEFVALPGAASRDREPAEVGRIECWVDRSPSARGASAAGGGPRAYVIEFTGNATRAEQIASFAAWRWNDLPVEVWVMNYPGYGQSTGPATLASIPPAALAVYDEVKKRAPSAPIFVAGNSLGTAAALYVASQRPCAGVVLQNPPALRSMILRQHGWYNLWLVAGPLAYAVPAQLDSPATAAKIRAPAVFILAQEDQTVSPANQQLVVRAYAGEKHVLKVAGGHNDPILPESEALLRQELHWLWTKGIKDE